ncbi:cytosine deaminase CodA [Gottschalkia acidurici 9a]|uniref:Cytosine deaminase CodA n=1 Tax=Gottschalkia acidurici (strain ATCC 7906 / DSM 604 / BCRC 14475 / CIP 104303 / KCTC 5404 / NCIMB 10678 / 9a) TaxID=1128398 RepID=K0AWG5_GOTA9|nr:amidohydrolase family protein [Gottschalkia acidurici]AFS77574.1 cytosine deaminase CodA [Gottschalkia acidurici 9a]
MRKLKLWILMLITTMIFTSTIGFADNALVMDSYQIASNSQNNQQQSNSYDYDILIKSGNVYKEGNKLDMAIKDGVIVAVKPNIKGSAKLNINADGKFISPGYLDTHNHLGKTNIDTGKESKTLMEAVKDTEEYWENFKDSEQIKKDVKERAEKTIIRMIKNGTTGIRTNVDLHIEAIEAVHELKVKYKDYIDIQIATHITDEDIIGPAIEKGWIDCIGAYAQPEWNSIENGTIDKAFELAQKYNLPIDIHVDESDEPNIDCFLYIIDKTIETGMQGKVTVGHVTALSAVDDDVAAKAIKKAAESGINVTSLTSCNMYLMGRSDTGIIRRGPTRVDGLLKAGVTVSYASDNIRDPFRPFGNGDMLEEGLLTAQIIQYGTKTDLNTVYDMGTYNPAKVMGYTNYGLKVGDRADIVILDAESAADALIGQATKLYVIKNGKLTVKNEKKSTILDIDSK